MESYPGKTAATGPFPLQGNLRKLKPNVGKGASGLLVFAYFIFDQFKDHFSRFIHQTELWVVVGLGLAILLYFVLDVYLRQVFFNENGVGIAMRFGGSATWYSFVELREANLRKRSGLRSRPKSSSLVMHFQTGTVKIRTGLYDKKGMEELTAIVEHLEERLRRVPGRLPDIQQGMPGTVPQWNQKQATMPPAYPKGPPKQPKDPGYRDLSKTPTPGKSKRPNLKQQLEEWNRKQDLGSSKNKK